MKPNSLSNSQKLEIDDTLNRIYLLLSLDFVNLSLLEPDSNQFDSSTRHFLSRIRKEIVKLLAVTGHSNIINNYLNEQNLLVSTAEDKAEVNQFIQNLKNRPFSSENLLQQMNEILEPLKSYRQLFAVDENHLKEQIKRGEAIVSQFAKPPRNATLYQFSTVFSQKPTSSPPSPHSPNKRKY